MVYSRLMRLLQLLLLLMVTVIAAPPANRAAQAASPTDQATAAAAGDSTRHAPPPDKDLVVSIVGGTISKPKKWHWIVLLLIRQRFVWKEAKCGGSLISPRHVLTAAHCVDRFKKEDMSVRLGEFDTTTYLDCQSQEYDVVQVTLHPNHKVLTFNNDIAILTISQPAKLSDCVRPIQLPISLSGDLAGQHVSVAGWGSSSFYGGRKSHVLLEATIPTVSEDACRKIYEANIDPDMLSTYFPGGFLKSTKLCAGTEQGDMDVCSGDSGGPMVLQQKDGSFVLVGVVSLGLYDCGVPGIPSIYSRVSAYLQWIAGVIRGSSRAAELIRALLTKSQVPTAGSPAQRYTPGNNAIQLPLQRAKSGDFRHHAQSARTQTAAKGAGSKDRTSEFRAYVEYILGKTGNLPHRSRVKSRHGEAASTTRESISGAAYQSPKDHAYGKTDTLQGSRAKSQGEQRVAAASSSIGDGYLSSKGHINGKTGITTEGSRVKTQGEQTVGAASSSIGDGYLSSKGHANGKTDATAGGSLVKSQGDTTRAAFASIGDGYLSSKGHINGKTGIPFQGSRAQSQGKTVGAAPGLIGDGYLSSKGHANGKIGATAERSRLKSQREGAVGAAGASVEAGYLSPKDPVNGITSHESQAKVGSGQAVGVTVADEGDIHRSLTTSSQAQQKRSGALDADHSIEKKHASRKLYSPREALAGSSVILDQGIGFVDNRVKLKTKNVAHAEQVEIGRQQGIATKELGNVSLRQKIATSFDDLKVQDKEATVSDLATDGNAGTRVGATELDKSSSVKTSVGQASQNKPASILQHKVGSTSQTRDRPKFQPKTTPTVQPAVIPTSQPTRYPPPPPSPSPTKPAEQKTWQELLKDVMKE